MTSRSSEYDWKGLHDVPAIRIYPKGGLKLIGFSGYDSWTSILPGLVGIVGLLSNKLIFHGRWVVQVRTRESPEASYQDGTRFIVGNRAEADLYVKQAFEWLGSHPSLSGFVPQSRPQA